MATLTIKNMSGQNVGEVNASDDVFAAPVREHLLWEVVNAQRAAARAGTSSSKRRYEVRGSSRKITKQKGTGNARHGSIRASLYVGGGIAHGPKPRSYAQRTPKQVYRAALCSALSLRNRENNLIVVDELAIESPKTKRVSEVMAALDVQNALIVEDRANTILALSTRNLTKMKFLPPEGLNVMDLLRYETLVVTSAALASVEQRLAR